MKPQLNPMISEKMASKRNSHVFIDDNNHATKTNNDGGSSSSSSSSTNITINHSHNTHHEDMAAHRSNSRGPSNETEDYLKTPQGTEESQGVCLTTKDSNSALRLQGVTAMRKDGFMLAIKRHDIGYYNKPLPTPPATEQQGHYPDAPLAGRPQNFGVVIPGVYRSGYPKPEDYHYLQGLKLNTIVTLVKKDEIDTELQDFVNEEGINQIVFNMKGTKKEAIPPSTMKSILDVVLDSRNYPLMIHCNHGKHRTGCVVAVLRKFHGWGVNNIVDEYCTYAAPKIRECDVEYISNFHMSTLWAGVNRPRPTAFRSRTFHRALVLSITVMFIWLISGTRLASSRPDV